MRSKVIKFILPRLSFFLGLKEEETQAIFRDGRTAAAFAPGWIRRAFELEETEKVFIRVMTDEVNFMPSRTRGVGRKGGVEDLLAHLSKFEKVAVVDVAEFPRVGFMIFEPEKVRVWVEEGMGVGGISRKQFLERTFLDRQRGRE